MSKSFDEGEIEWLVSRFIRHELDQVDYTRIREELQNKRFTIYNREYTIENSDEEIRKIFTIPFDAPIKVKASITDDKVRLDLFWIDRKIEEEIVKEKKIEGLSHTLIYKVVKIIRKAIIKSVFAREEKEVEIDSIIEERFEDFLTGRRLNTDEELVEHLGIKVIKEVDVPTLRQGDYLSNYLQTIYVFSDGTVLGFYGYRIVHEEGGEPLTNLGFADYGGESYEVPVLKFINTSYIYDVLGEILAERLYKTAIKLYHKKENEEYKKQREQWIEEFKEAQRKQEDLEKFLLSKKNSYFTKDEIEWLRSISPARNDCFIYFDGINGIEVLDMLILGKVKIKVGREVFEVPVK
jgi:hypothetical protein